jgi:hypothetical protein
MDSNTAHSGGPLGHGAGTFGQDSATRGADRLTTHNQLGAKQGNDNVVGVGLPGAYPEPFEDATTGSGKITPNVQHIERSEIH